MKTILDLTNMEKTDVPEPPNKIKYIKKSDGKILEETVNRLLGEQSTLDWYEYDPEAKGKPSWNDPGFGKAMAKAAAGDYIVKEPKGPEDDVIDMQDIEIEASPTEGFGSVMGLEDTLRDIEAKEWPKVDDYFIPEPASPDDIDIETVPEPVPVPVPTTIPEPPPVPPKAEVPPVPEPEIEKTSTKPTEFELVQYTGNENIIIRTKTEEYGDPLRHSYAHPDTVKYLDSLGDIGGGGWHIGDISKKAGGKLTGHKSHREGLDMDIAIPLKAGGMSTRDSKRGRSWEFKKVKPEEIDAERALALVRHSAASNAEYVFLDRKLIKEISNKADSMIKDGGMEQKEYDSLFGVKGGKGVVRHWPGHGDHFHIRLHASKPQPEPQSAVEDFEQEVETSLQDTELQKKVDELKPERNIVETSEVKDAPEGYNHSYTFSRVGSATPLEEYNSDAKFYGASMQKPILALMNLITQPKDSKQRLNEADLDRLISYHGTGEEDSNTINKRIAGYTNNEKAAEWLKNLGLENQTIRRMRHGNEQTSYGYTKFLSQLMNYKNHPYLSQYPEASEAVLSRIMSNSTRAEKGSRGSHEAKNFEQIRKMVNKELGYEAIESMHGKGGRAFGARNFAFVVKPTNSSEQYIFTMYTQDPDKRGTAPRERYTRSHRITAQKLAEMIRKHNVGKR